MFDRQTVLTDQQFLALRGSDPWLVDIARRVGVLEGLVGSVSAVDQSLLDSLLRDSERRTKKLKALDSLVPKP